MISLLHKIRFFNRFTFEQLMLLIKRVTMRQLKKGQVLYLGESESAILLSGKLHLMCYKEDLHRPYVARLYHPGDLIGLKNIDNGWSTEQHSWVCALQDCDVFYVSSAYLDMLWGKMKGYQSNLVAEILQKCPQFRVMSEQTLFTIANDIAEFKEFQPGEIIVEQDLKSPYNLNNLFNEV